MFTTLKKTYRPSRIRGDAIETRRGRACGAGGQVDTRLKFIAAKVTADSSAIHGQRNIFPVAVNFQLSGK